MAGQFPRDAGGAVAILVEVVDGADVIETTTRNEVTARGVGAGHDPRRTERDCVDLVRRVRVPNDELPVLRS